eukprot:GHVS01005027.1.p1 GENE.GHVS01005027.1~~GHVS01005027.1.p1  ORF type:complete len:744 (-),score=227.20 GHVS01005027.1:107-2338(-)
MEMLFRRCPPSSSSSPRRRWLPSLPYSSIPSLSWKLNSSRGWASKTTYPLCDYLFSPALSSFSSSFLSSRRGACQFAYDSFEWSFHDSPRPYRYVVAEPLRKKPTVHHIHKQPTFSPSAETEGGTGTTTATTPTATPTTVTTEEEGRCFGHTFVCLPPIGHISNREDMRELCRHLCTEYEGSSTTGGVEGLHQTAAAGGCNEEEVKKKTEEEDPRFSSVVLSYNQCLCLEWPGAHNDPFVNLALQPVGVRHFDEGKDYVQRAAIGKEEEMKLIEERKHNNGKIIAEEIARRLKATTAEPKCSSSSSLSLPSLSAISTMSASSSSNVPTATSLPCSSRLGAALPPHILSPNFSLQESLHFLYVDFLKQFLSHLLLGWRCPRVVLVAANNATPVVLQCLREIRDEGNWAAAAAVGVGTTTTQEEQKEQNEEQKEEEEKGVGGGASKAREEDVTAQVDKGGEEGSELEEVRQEELSSISLSHSCVHQIEALVLCSPSWQSPLRRYHFRRAAAAEVVDVSEEAKVADVLKLDMWTDSRGGGEQPRRQGEKKKSGGEKKEGGMIGQPSSYQLEPAVVSKQFRRLVKMLQNERWLGKATRKFMASKYFVRKCCERGYVDEMSEQLLQKKLYAASRLTYHELHAAVLCGLLDVFSSEQEYASVFSSICLPDSSKSDTSHLPCLLLLGTDSAAQDLRDIWPLQAALQHYYETRANSNDAPLKVQLLEGASAFAEEFPKSTADAIHRHFRGR